MNVVHVFFADIYRDGGSYGFTFLAEDGHEDEFFLKTRAFEQATSETHAPPVIYREGVNSGVVVKELSWEQGQVFIAPLGYLNDRFDELVHIVNASGRANG